jgi:hypothetical protein
MRNQEKNVTRPVALQKSTWACFRKEARLNVQALQQKVLFHVYNLIESIKFY